ncbi:hypothetical protein C8R43DRAFT_950543 [Mycena crocata]|nr:hypothetical protein C8R43DRAFT_950543 [Mycena crocata]
MRDTIHALRALCELGKSCCRTAARAAEDGEWRESTGVMGWSESRELLLIMTHESQGPGLSSEHGLKKVGKQSARVRELDGWWWLVDSGRRVGDEQLEGAFFVAVSVKVEQAVIGEGVANGKAANLCEVDGKGELLLLVRDVERGRFVAPLSTLTYRSESAATRMRTRSPTVLWDKYEFVDVVKMWWSRCGGKRTQQKHNDSLSATTMNGLSAYLLQKITMFSNPVGLSPSTLNSEIDEPWYATSFGLISHDKERLFESLDEVIENPPKGKSASDYPVFSAQSFEGIVQYLPACTSLKRCFQRDSKGRKRQHKIIYYVVDGDRTVFTDMLSNATTRWGILGWSSVPTDTARLPNWDTFKDVIENLGNGLPIDLML